MATFAFEFLSDVASLKQSWTLLNVLRHDRRQLLLFSVITGHRGYSLMGLAVGTRALGTRFRCLYRVSYPTGAND